MLQAAGSYEKVFEALKTVQESDLYYQNGIRNDVWIEENLVFDFAEGSDSFSGIKESPTVSESGQNGGSSEAGGELSYSETNVQVEGIDEADCIKTDGEYLYILNANRNEIYLVKADGGNMKLTSVIDVAAAEKGDGRELYLLDDRLVLVTCGWREEETDPQHSDGTYYSSREKAVTGLLTYDISDRETPKLLSALEQDGSLITSRCTEGRVYLITSYGSSWRWYSYIDEEADGEELYRYIPCAEGERIGADCIYISEEPVSEEFLVLTAMSPENPRSFLDVKAFMAGGEHCYVSSNYIYVGSSRWQNREIPYDRTELYRFSYADGVIAPAGQVTVKGTLNNQFSMDEYNGYLRIVTTVNEYEYDYERLKENLKDYNGDGRIDDTDMDEVFYWAWPVISEKESNALYLYDENLQMTGSIEDLAPEEHIKSARLLGDVGYFVTFRQTDPLFSVDLSNPANPVILGELKIPGFSEYLHPYGEGLLLGIGRDADESSGFTRGVKLSMFDVSDPANVKEVHKAILKEFSYSGVSDNHKAALIDAEKDLIGFPARGYSGNGEYNVYLVFGYDAEKGFYQKLSEGYAMDWGEEEDYNSNFKYQLFFADCRGVYIGEVLYLVNPAYEVRAYDMRTWEQIGREGLVTEIEERQALLSRIREAKPEPIVIELEANPSTGYSWCSTTEGGAVMLSKVESIVPEGAEQLPGSPITQRYTFEVSGIGTTTVTFEYARAWESQKPIRTVVYKISVGEDLQAVVESVTEW